MGYITMDDLVNGAIDLGKDCLRNGVGPMTQMEISNGEMSANMDSMLYKQDPKFYWSIKTSRLQLDIKDSPAFVAAYDRRAQELGLTPFYMTIEWVVVVIVSLLAVALRKRQVCT